MRILCNHCQQIIELDDEDVKEYVKKLNPTSPAMVAANRIKAKLPRPGSLGNTRAKRKE